MAQSRPPDHAGALLTLHVVTPPLGRTLNVRSPGIGSDGWIDDRHVAKGDDLSPALSWSAVPEAKSFAVVAEDPDAPGDEPFLHWMMWDIPGDSTGLPQGVDKAARPTEPAGAIQGVNDAGRHGWFGPKPPAGHGVHRYHLQVFALSTKLNLSPEVEFKTLVNALKGVTLASGELVGLYETPGRPEIRSRDKDHAPEPFPGRPGDEPRGAAVDSPRT